MARISPVNAGVWRKGRGKGGHRLAIVNNRLEKAAVTKEEKEERISRWKTFMIGYKADINQLIATTNSDKVKCPDCDKSIMKTSFMRHMTLQGCPNLKPETKRYKWIEGF